LAFDVAQKKFHQDFYAGSSMVEIGNSTAHSRSMSFGACWPSLKIGMMKANSSDLFRFVLDLRRVILDIASHH
jgi:hypothetical protein